MAKRDVPTDTNDWNKSRPANTLDARTWPEGAVRETTFTRRPETALQALLETAPGEEPETSIEELIPIREAVAAAIERLPPRLRFVIEAIHMERLSYQQLANRMGISKTHAFRLTKDAEECLRQMLNSNQLIRERLNLETRHATWWEAAASHLSGIAPTEELADKEILSAIQQHADVMRTLADSGDEERYNEFVASVIGIGRSAAQWLNNHGEWSVTDMADLLESKQSDYGHGNIAAFGMFGVVVRLSDKIERMLNLDKKQGKARNESYLDTMRDMVGYSIIALMLDDGTFYMEI